MFSKAAFATAFLYATSVIAIPADYDHKKEEDCKVEEIVVPLHKDYGKGYLPKKFEDCVVYNLGPEFINILYNAYHIEDHSFHINGEKVEIKDSVIQNGGKNNVVGDGNVVGDQNSEIIGDGNGVNQGEIKGDAILGTGNGNGNGNTDIVNSGNKNSTVDSGNIQGNKDNIVDSAVDNNDNAIGNDDNAIGNDDNVIGNDDNAIGNDDNAIGNEGSGNDGNIVDNNDNNIGNEGSGNDGNIVGNTDNTVIPVDVELPLRQ